LLYLLANGINNSDRLIWEDTGLKPEYFVNLRQDLEWFSSNQITNDDIAITSIFPNIPVPQPLAFLQKHLNRFKDILILRAEADVPWMHLGVVGDIMSEMLSHRGAERPVLGFGYSGGFAPMLEAMNAMGVHTQMIVGVGAATINPVEIEDTLHMLVNSIAALENERFLDQNFGDFVSKVKAVISTVYDNTVGRIPILGNLFKAIVNGLFGTVQKTIDWVVEAANALVDMVGKTLEATRIQWLLRNQSIFGLSSVDDAQGVLNIFGDRDILVDLGVAGKMSSIAGFTGNKVLDIEIKSYTDPATGKTANADHYIYMHDTRDYSKIDDPVEQALQQDFDDRVANFVVQLLVAGVTMDGAKTFLNDPASANFVKQNSDGTYEFWPFGTQP